MCLAKDYTDTLLTVLTSIQENKEKLRSIYSDHDKRINELYHEIEIERYNAAEGFLKLRELQSVLRRRRLIKQELSQLDRLNGNMNIDNISSQIKKAANSIDKNNEEHLSYRDGWNVKIEDLLVSV